MKTQSRHLFPIGSVLALGLVLASSGCWAADPCGEGLVVGNDYQCHKPAVAAVASEAGTSEAGTSEAGTSEAGTSEAGTSEAGAPVTTKFGVACSTPADCGGDAPICAAPQLPYCTQIMCNAGEANAGACPAGFVCLSSAQGSACVKM